MAEEKATFGDWRDNLTPQQQADFFEMQENRKKTEAIKYSSDVPVKKNEATIEKTRYRRGPDGNWEVEGREFEPKQTSKQTHTVVNPPTKDIDRRVNETAQRRLEKIQKTYEERK